MTTNPTTEPLKYNDEERAVIHLNIYAGKNCDERGERDWKFESDGSPDFESVVTLKAKHFPPGTQLVVMQPICPDCESPRYPSEISTDGSPTQYEDKCECGFSWTEWEDNEYA